MQSRRFVVISGMSGAGRTTVLRSLEDLGYQAIDNIPLRYLAELPEIYAGPVAVSVDTRTLDFTPEHFVEALQDMRLRHEDIHFLFLDCEEHILQTRYKQTRRPHPYLEEDLPGALRREYEIMRPLRHQADLVFDTSHKTVEQTNLWMREQYGHEKSPRLILQLLSFSYRFGVPVEADIVFDARFLKNPFYEPNLRDHNGREKAVQNYLRSDPLYDQFVTAAFKALELSLKGFRLRGRSYVTVAFGCTGGKHRSVFLVESFSKLLQDDGIIIKVNHRELIKEA